MDHSIVPADEARVARLRNPHSVSVRGTGVGFAGGPFPISKGIRLLGVTLSNLETESAESDGQLSLID